MQFNTQYIHRALLWAVCNGFIVDQFPIFFRDVSLAPGPRLNIKTVLSMYGDFHVKDKTAVRTSYL